jgi:hypothetical protein
VYSNIQELLVLCQSHLLVQKNPHLQLAKALIIQSVHLATPHPQIIPKSFIIFRARLLFQPSVSEAHIFFASSHKSTHKYVFIVSTLSNSVPKCRAVKQEQAIELH